ncbi:MAG: arginase family protein, partial [Proteobacteria bacterium]|nr:arginase family protein [Pseudomonadota bacterium]
MTKSSLIEKLKVLEEGLPCTPESGFLGTDLDPEECSLILVPVPWEATTSYGGGTSQGPKAIMKASHQLDLEDSSFGKSYRAGIAFIEPNSEIAALNSTAKEAAQEVIAAVSERNSSPENLAIVNQAGLRVNEIVNEEVEHWLAKGKFVAVVGGDHSSPQGLIEALSKRYTEGFGILHFDAHHDLRSEYEGFKFSHASIFYNVMHEFKNVSKIVQVGIRDYSRDEKNFMIQLKERGHCFY